MKFTNKEEILKFSKKYIGRTFEDIFSQELIGYDTEKPNKGAVGNKVEKLYGLKPNPRRDMDFLDFNINMELKCTPIKTLKSGKIRPADRLILGMIDYSKVHSKRYRRRLNNKINNLLVWSYMKEKGAKNGTYTVDHIFEMKIPNHVMVQIHKDYNAIAQKVKEGNAHLISGKDTVYLEACTKRSGGPENYYVAQPNSDTKAKSRAFSFKSKAMVEIYKYNGIIED